MRRAAVGALACMLHSLPHAASCPPTPQMLLRFSAWRWCFFLCLWPVIYWVSVWIMWALTK